MSNDTEIEDPFEARCIDTRKRIESSECTDKQKGNLLEMLDNVEPKDNVALGEVNKMFAEYVEANDYYPPPKKEKPATQNYKAMAAEHVVRKALEIAAIPVATKENVGPIAIEICKALDSIGVKSNREDVANLVLGNSHRGASGISNEVCILCKVYE